MRGMQTLAGLALLSLAVFALALQPAARFWRATELLLALSSPPAAASLSSAVVERELVLPSRGGPIRARLYRRSDVRRGDGLVLSHGVHYRGIDERRLVPFARELARAGLVVLTPELDDLVDYRITRRGLEVIRDSALWLGRQHELVRSPRVGLLGMSFAGGLSLVAAGEPVLRDRLAYVTSVGGHHDLRRVLRFLLTDQIEAPGGLQRSPAHEYGLVVLLYQNLDHFVVESDRSIMRAAVRAWLREDRAAAYAFASLRTTAASEALFGLLETGKLKQLAPDLVRLVEEQPAELALLSPSKRMSRIQVPVYLLHGKGDSVIPPTETEWASRELGSHDHHALISPLLEHVEVSESPGIAQQVALVDFMANML